LERRGDDREGEMFWWFQVDLERLNFRRVDDGDVGISFCVCCIRFRDKLALSVSGGIHARVSSSLDFEEFPVRACCSEGTFVSPLFPSVFGNVLRSIIINLFLSSLPLSSSSSSSSSSLLQVCFVLVFLFSFRSLCFEFERFFKFRSLRSLVCSSGCLCSDVNLGRKWRVFEQFRRYHLAVACRHYCNSRMNSRSWILPG
jgi:hypothetical protein